MYKALIIGCGNIGAMYDFEDESISTYAKAFSLDPEIDFEVYDLERNVARKVAERYGIRWLNELNPALYREYDIIAICTPTFTHHEYLSKMFEHGPRLVICEKPVDTDRTRLEKILSLYQTSNIRVMVNFFRRFQPGIIQLKKEIEGILVEERCTNIVVTYQRGFHNNASHAVDLLEYLFGSEIDLSEALINHKAFDEFDTDPTLSLCCEWNGAHVQFVGLTYAEFSHFDVAIYFTSRAVVLEDCGNEIKMLAATASSGNFYSKLKLQKRETGVTENYMEHVVAHAKRLLTGVELNDNFQESVSISHRILQLQGN
ncbi:MAG: Gfo/Idh/MocA family oxidoreductase [Chlorobiaceae bacterium]|nr:Gfo/Idh/MocA family oxidoreductase [Chlorobiaceae bacterium]